MSDYLKWKVTSVKPLGIKGSISLPLSGGWNGSLVMCKIVVPSIASKGLQNWEINSEKQMTGSGNSWILIINSIYSIYYIAYPLFPVLNARVVLMSH